MVVNGINIDKSGLLNEKADMLLTKAALRLLKADGPYLNKAGVRSIAV